MMQDQALDFHITFRLLCHYIPASETSTIIKDLLSTSTSSYPLTGAEKAWDEWLGRYAVLIGDSGEEARKEVMLNANPRFVLRQWVLEELIKAVEEGLKVENGDEEEVIRRKWEESEGKKMLDRVYKVRFFKYKKYGIGADVGGR
jgi:uncharacterized protein YdiU (UPF0061 family)